MDFFALKNLMDTFAQRAREARAVQGDHLPAERIHANLDDGVLSVSGEIGGEVFGVEMPAPAGVEFLRTLIRTAAEHAANGPNRYRQPIRLVSIRTTEKAA